MEIAIALLQHYSFDLGGYTIKDLTRAWGGFKPEWVRQAVIESLFRGRYKAVSVSQILALWERKGEPNCRYNHEFERLVCGDVAIIYEDRIFYTPPRTSARQDAITEIAPFTSSEAQDLSIPFPHRSIMGNANITQVSQPQSYPSRVGNPSGTTRSSQAYSKTYAKASKAEYSEVYRSAYENMALLAESSIFVDKLRSMCGDRLIIPAIANEVNKLKVPTTI